MAVKMNVRRPATPAERLRWLGGNDLSEGELLSLLLVTGDPLNNRKAPEVAERLIDRFGGLHRLDQAAFQELAGVQGIGNAKAARLKAALELGRRLLWPRLGDHLDLSNPQTVFEAYGPRLGGLPTESLWAVLLDHRLRWRRDLPLAKGDEEGISLRLREVFLPILKEEAHSVLFVHNHPSGDPRPSRADLRMTLRFCLAGELLGIAVQDHIIIAGENYFSLADHGLISPSVLEAHLDPGPVHSKPGFPSGDSGGGEEPETLHDVRRKGGPTGG